MSDENVNQTDAGNGGHDRQASPQDQKNQVSQFDWIKARADCTLPKVFAELRRQIEADVNTRNGLRPKTAPYAFSLKEDTKELRVTLEADQLRTSVVFALADHAIVVRDAQGTQMFEVTLFFDELGNCRLNVNGQQREFWQVRRMALEDLMFRGL